MNRSLNEFFTIHQAPIDIVLILNGALSFVDQLAHYVDDNNMLFYHPRTSHKRVASAPFLEGEMHPERTVLICDVDMISGETMKETATFFEESGYARSKIYGYLNTGCFWRPPYRTELMHIDDLLYCNSLLRIL
jgi:hypoxanthine-guanine phosphoribosyltransferase